MKDIGVLDYVVCGGDKTQNIRNLDAALHKFFDVSKSRGILNYINDVVGAFNSYAECL